MRFFLSVLLLFLFGKASIAQRETIPIGEWVKEMSDPDDKKNQASRFLWDSVVKSRDSLRMNTLLQQLQAKENNGNAYYQVRLNLFEALVLNHNDILRSAKSKNVVMELMKQAMREANETNDEYLVAYASSVYSYVAGSYNELDLSVTYAMYSAELNEKLFGINEFLTYFVLADQMYLLKEYDKCKRYCLKWLSISPARETKDHEGFRKMITNTLALTYHRTGRYDSAMYYYNKALALAVKLKNRVWIGIVSGNMGQVYYQLNQYDTAITLLETNYRINIESKYFYEAANALQWLARANTDMGNKAKGLQQIREAMVLIRPWSHENYQRNIYEAASKVFAANGLMDSAMYYSRLYQQLHDSIERKINAISVAIPNVRLTEEKNRHNIRMLQEEKKSQLLIRNIIILGIVLLFVIIVLIVNRQRVKYRLHQEVLQTEKKLLETRMAAERQQKEMYTQHTIEKSSLIKNLEQMKGKDASAVQQENIRVLTNLTILTEQDWDKFKELFEKTYPMFFQQLKTKASGITVAEQRMAALTRLQLTTRQMAAMQGISPDSVHKTRQRLRQRLGVSNEINLEDYFGSFHNNLM